MENEICWRGVVRVVRSCLEMVVECVLYVTVSYFPGHHDNFPLWKVCELHFTVSSEALEVEPLVGNTYSRSGSADVTLVILQ